MTAALPNENPGREPSPNPVRKQEMNAVIMYDIICVYFFVMVISVVYWAANITSLNNSGYTRISSLLSCAVCIYIFGYAMELGAGTTEQILFWNRFEYFGIPYISALWLTVALVYTGHFARHRLLLCLLIYSIPVLSMVFRLTNDAHHWYYSSYEMVTQASKLLLKRTYGPWMYVQSIHSMLMIFLSLGLFIVEALRNDERAWGKIRLIMAASIIAVAGLVLSYTKPGGYVLDYMAICLPLACLMVIIAIVRFDFLEIKLLAHSKSFEANKDAQLLLNRHSRIIDDNRKAKLLFSQLGIRLAHGYLKQVFQSNPLLLETLNRDDTVVLRLPIDGKERFFEFSTNVLNRDEHNQVDIKTIADVTENHEMTLILRRQAMMDELSGLHNRRSFVQEGGAILQQALAEGKRVHMLMMDIDHFKDINDQFGHQTGDQMIQYMGRKLQEKCQGDSLIARVGGEEFAVLLIDNADEVVGRHVDSFVQEIAAQNHTDHSTTFHMTVSIGISVAQKGDDLYSLMRRADNALYQSKDAGRNCVRWNAMM